MGLLQSPLRYPGGKLALVDYIVRFLCENKLIGGDFVEPFAGGAAVAINLVHLGCVKKATIVEQDPLVFSFWAAVKAEPGVLCDRVRRVTADMATWRRFQQYKSADARSRFELLDLGLAGLFFNRTNYSGIIGANPIGGMDQKSQYLIDCRFNKDTLVQRICDLSIVMKKIDVVYGDGMTYLRSRRARLQRDRVPVYIDPPYFREGKKLYRYHFVPRQHKRLARLLNESGFPWLVSYDDDPFIRELFEKQKFQAIFLNYAVRQARRADELLITNQKRLPVASGKLGPEIGLIENDEAVG